MHAHIWETLAEWVKGLREGWEVSGSERTEITQPRSVGSPRGGGYKRLVAAGLDGGRDRWRGLAVNRAEVAIGKPHRST